jgi:acyl-CoA thioesterase I
VISDWVAHPSRVLVSESRRNNLLPAIAFVFSVFIAVPATAQDKIDMRDAQIRYVAIGDSYSIGEGASPDESWPAVLTRHLNEKGLRVDLVANPSRTGWTTQQAIDRELPVFLSAKPNFATLQIGVNDWVQGVDAETFRKRFIFLVDRMLGVLRDKNRLLVVTIPDFGVTPTGPRYARGRNISEGIAAFNKIVTEESKKRGLQIVDVFELSKQMGKDRSLVAADGLHPSAKEYAEWEKIIFPAALQLPRTAGTQRGK